VSAGLDVVVFGEKRDESISAGKLVDAAEDDLGTSVVEFHGAANFDDAAFKHAHIADVFQIGGEDDDGKGASRLVLTEVEEVDSLVAELDAMDFAGDALCFSDMLVRFVDRNAEAESAGQKRKAVMAGVKNVRRMLRELASTRTRLAGDSKRGTERL
jgi:hypothetical protein